MTPRRWPPVRDLTTGHLENFVGAVMAHDNPNMGDVRRAQHVLAELGRRAGRPDCGTTAGWWRHDDAGERPCLLCRAHRLLREGQHERREARRNASRRSPRRQAQQASREAHKAAWEAYSAEHPPPPAGSRWIRG